MTATAAPPSTLSTGAPRRSTWALWGTAAGVLGLVTNMIAQPQVTEKERLLPSAVEKLSSGTYRLGALAGFLAVACLLLFAGGLRRWAAQQPGDSAAARAAGYGLVASAGALIAAYGVKGQLAAYLDGGFNEESYPDDHLYALFLLDDLAGFFGWWGVAVAGGCLAWLAFRERVVVRWVGVLGALMLLAPLAFLVVVGFTGFSGVICPVLLIPVGIGLALRRE